MLGKKPELVGIIGLGIIGRRVARVLRDAGDRVYVWNRTPVEEPNFLGSPEDVASHAQLIQIFVKDGPACLDVIEKMRPVLTRNHVIVNSASIHPDETRFAAEVVRGAGALYVEAPFTGSREAAAQGKLNYYVSGDLSAFAKAKGMLEKSSASITPMGESYGTASFIKIVTNMLSTGVVTMLAECLALVEKSGIAPQTLERALEVNANRSGLTGMKLPAMIQEDFSPAHFSLSNMLKDMRIAQKMAEENGLDLPVLTAAAGALSESETHGRGALDFCAVIQNHRSADFQPETD